MTVFLYIFISSALAFLLIRPSVSLAHRWGLLDDPRSSLYKIHQSITPRAGGLVLFPTFVLVNLLTGTLQDAELFPLVVSAIVIFIFGIWDDRKSLTAPWKFLGQLIATVILINGGVFVQITDLPILNIALTIFWMVGVTNAFNLVDSKDGLALGLAILAASFFMLVTQEAGQQSLAFFSAILLGTCLALFYFNAEPATLFLGDSGAQVLGFLLAGLAIAYTPPGLPQASSWFVPILLLAVPIFDTTLVTVSRLRRGMPVFQGNLDHTYHRLVSLGIPSQRAIRTLHMGAMLLSCVAFIALTLPPLLANLIFILCLLTGLAAIIWLEQKGLPSSLKS